MQLFRDRAISLELVFRVKDTALQLVRPEAIALLERLRLGDELIDRADFILTALWMGIAEEQVRRARNLVTKSPSQNIRHRHVPLLADQNQARDRKSVV